MERIIMSTYEIRVTKVDEGEEYLIYVQTDKKEDIDLKAIFAAFNKGVEK